MPRFCCVPGCNSNHRYTVPVSTFAFPKDEENLEKWLAALHVDKQFVVNKKWPAVCMKHFPESDVIKEDRMIRADGTLLVYPRKIPALVKGAVPTIISAPHVEVKLEDIKVENHDIERNAEKQHDESDNYSEDIDTKLQVMEIDLPKRESPQELYEPDNKVVEDKTNHVNDKLCHPSCCVLGCDSTRSRNSDVVFHKFPIRSQHQIKMVNSFGKQEMMDKQKAWEITTKKKGSPDLKVCSLHFEPSDYIPTSAGVKRECLKPNAVPSLNMPTQDVIRAMKRRRKTSKFESDEGYRFVDVNAIKEGVEISKITPPSSLAELPSKNVGTQTESLEVVEKPCLDTCIETDQSNLLNYIRNEILNVTLKLENNKYSLAEVQLYFTCEKKPGPQDSKDDFIVIRRGETAATNVRLMQAFALCPVVRKKRATPKSGTRNTTDDRKKNCNPASKLCDVTESQNNGDPLNSVNDGEVTETESIPLLDVDDPEITYPIDMKLMTRYVNVNNTFQIKQVHMAPRENDLMCVYCMALFEDSLELIEHCREKLCRRKQEVPENALCELCGIVVGYKRLRKHIIDKHDNRPLNYQCSICGKLFAHRYLMTKHVLIHAIKRNFKCSQCPKCYKTREGLRGHTHMRHTDPTQWKHECNRCKKRFSHKWYLLHHERAHSDPRYYECEMCKQITPSKKLRDKHIATCSKRNETATDANRTSDNVCSCFYCFESFLTERLLDEHVVICSERKTTTGTSADFDFEHQIGTVVEPDSGGEVENSVQKERKNFIGSGDERVVTSKTSKQSGESVDEHVITSKRSKQSEGSGDERVVTSKTCKQRGESADEHVVTSKRSKQSGGSGDERVVTSKTSKQSGGSGVGRVVTGKTSKQSGESGDKRVVTGKTSKQSGGFGDERVVTSKTSKQSENLVSNVS